MSEWFLTVPWRVAKVEIFPPFGLYVVFNDGLAGSIDLSQIVTSPNAGVFSKLSDPAIFAQAFLHYGAVTWPSGVDFAPDAMYEEIRRQGEWCLVLVLLSWFQDLFYTLYKIRIKIVNY